METNVREIFVTKASEQLPPNLLLSFGTFENVTEACNPMQKLKFYRKFARMFSLIAETYFEQESFELEVWHCYLYYFRYADKFQANCDLWP